MLDTFLVKLGAEKVTPSNFWEVFYDSSKAEQEQILDVLKETSFEYQAYLANEALRES